MSKTANELYDKPLRLPTGKYVPCSCRRMCGCWARAYSWNMDISRILANRMEKLHPKDTVTPGLVREWYDMVSTSFFVDHFRRPLLPYMDAVKQP